MRFWPGMVEAGRERLPVAMDVGEQCDPHGQVAPGVGGNGSLRLTAVNHFDLRQEGDPGPFR